jgi:hypothetical protein
MNASIELAGKVLRLCGHAMAQEPCRGRHSAPHISPCGRVAAGLSKGLKLAFRQSVTAIWRILDTIGVGQYGPRGFEGGEHPETLTTRMSNNVRQLA